MPNPIERASRGALSGALATVPMSAVMLASQKLGGVGRLPPEIITRRALAAANQPVSSSSEKAIAAAAHFGFGAAAGAAFGLLGENDDDLALAMTKGAAFGLALYALSHAGWIPALDILPPPQRDRENRQTSLIAAHAVYGAALGALTRRA